MLEALLLIRDTTVLSVMATVSGIFLLLSLLYQKHRTERGKWILFLGVSVPIAVGSLFLIASTIYENTTSFVGGPVHWHADFQIYNCGEFVNLRDPEGLVNRIGTPLSHEHNDDRIHVEGTIRDESEAGLPAFFSVIGGELKGDRIAIPTNDGLLLLTNGERCPDGQAAELQIFVYRMSPDGTVTQEKLTDFFAYRMTHSSRVPPGDCIVIEFGAAKEKTDHICPAYAASLMTGDAHLK